MEVIKFRTEMVMNATTYYVKSECITKRRLTRKPGLGHRVCQKQDSGGTLVRAAISAGAGLA